MQRASTGVPCFFIVCELRIEEPLGFRRDEARAVEGDVSSVERAGEVKKGASDSEAPTGEGSRPFY